MIILGTNSIKDTGFDVANSLRFNTGSSDYLNRTATSGNRQVATFSGWLKKGSNGVDTNRVFLEYNSGTNYFEIRWRDADNLRIYEELNGGTGFELITNRLFRDPSAWYHIVVAIDTTQGTAANRIKLYVNGVQETSFATETYPSQNYNVQMNVANKAVQIGAYSFSGSNYFNGYMSEMVWLDGTAAAITDLGEFDEDSGIWKPINVSGLTFGNNGFYLDFEDSSALGNDAAGSNNFTVNNLTAIDQSIDSCTNNFATLNPLAGRNNPNAYYATFSEGNLKLVGNSSTNNGNAFSTMAFNTGKWYCEVKMVDADNSLFPCVGVITEDLVASANSPSNAGQIGQNDSDTVAYAPDGEKVVGGTESSYGDTFTNNDIIGIAIDCDNGAVYFSKNGTFQASGDPTSGASKTNAAMTFTPGKYYFFGGSVYKNTNDIEFNFGSPPFAISSGNTDGNGYGNMEFSVPSGYYILNSKNLAEYG